MTRASHGALAVTLLYALICACGTKTSRVPDQSNAPATGSSLASISVTRTVSLPVRTVKDPSEAATNPAILTITQSSDDEPSQGPSTFDVRPDKGFVVADPLSKRVVFYDASGRYQQELLIYISPQHVRVLPNNALSVVRYQTGERYIYDVDSSGNYKAPRLATASDPDPDVEDRGEANLEGPRSAVVRTASPDGTQLPPVRIRFDRPGEDMVSVSRLGSDKDHTYVLIDSSAPSDTIFVKSSVWKYTRGRPVGEVSDASSDYSVAPEDPFRLRDGIVYQLVPKNSEVRINVWDTNSFQ